MILFVCIVLKYNTTHCVQLENIVNITFSVQRRAYNPKVQKQGDGRRKKNNKNNNKMAKLSRENLKTVPTHAPTHKHTATTTLKQMHMQHSCISLNVCLLACLLAFWLNYN